MACLIRGHRGSPIVRKRVNLYLNINAVERSKKNKLNISALAEDAIKKAIEKGVGQK